MTARQIASMIVLAVFLAILGKKKLLSNKETSMDTLEVTEKIIRTSIDCFGVRNKEVVRILGFCAVMNMIVGNSLY